MSFIPTEYSDPIFVYSLRNVFPRYGGPLVRVIRESDHIEGDVYPDDNGEVSYDSTIIVNPSETSALVLGEFLNIDGYTDADGLGEVYEGRLSKIYDQSAGSFDVGVNIYNVSFLFVETNLPAYGGSTAIHKVNGVPAFFATATQPMFKLAQARGREVSYHFMTEGVGATQYFGFIEGTNTYGIWGLHDIEAEITSATLFPTQQWDINAVYFDSELGDNSFVSNVYSSETFNNFDSVITTVEAQLLDTATTQTAFPDNEVTFNVMSNNWYCDIVAFDGYDPIRRITIEQLYAQAASNTTAFAKTSSLLINNENPNQSGFLAQFPNAAAAYSVRSLTGNTGTDGPKILRVRRAVDNIEVDVYTDNSGWVSLDSPIENVYETTINTVNREYISLATTLGEFVADPSYNNPDNITTTTATVSAWYDQSKVNTNLLPLQVTDDEAAAAYSVRLLNPEYNGPLLKVRRSSDNVTKDIYPNANGELDVDDIEQFIQEGVMGPDYTEEYLLDIIPDGETEAPQAAAAYSLRKLKASYTGPLVRVRRTDGKEVDVYPQQDGWFGLESPIENLVESPVEEGDFDGVLTFKYFAQNDNITVVTWYDQSGSSNDATQDQTSSQPKIYDSVTGVVLKNGEPAVDFDGTSDFLSGSLIISSATASTHFIALSADSVGPNERIFNHLGEGVNQRNSSFVSSQFNIYDGTNGLSVGSAETSSDYLITCRFVSNDATIHVNGVLQGTSNLIVQKEVTDFNLGTQGSFYFDGTIQEYIIYSSDQDASGNRPTIEKNINNAFSIYGGWEATVETWYDQSGNGNDASQSDTNAQPAIARGGVVIRENGKPAIEGDGTNGKHLTTSDTTLSGDLAVITVCSFDTFNLDSMVFGGTNPATKSYLWRQGTTQMNWKNDSENGFANFTVSLLTANNLIFGNRAGTDVSMAVNGSNNTVTENATQGLSFTINRIGGALQDQYSLDGTYQEMIFYNSDQSDNRPLIEKSINSYYNIYAQDAAVQNVSTAQPKIYDSSAGIVTDNGKPAVEFSNTSVFDEALINGNNTSDFFTVFNTSDARHILNANASSFSLITQSGSTSLAYSNFGTPSYRINASAISITTRNDAYNVTSIGQQLLLNASGDSSSWTTYNIIYRSDPTDSFNLDGKIQEVVYYNTTITSETRIDIENNINSAFQIYAAKFPSVLDTVPLAKAAYSIRRLTKNYIDPIITVTNGSTTKDFYADFWGNLDVDALTSFANGGTLSVTKWWDQSGEGVHLLTTADKPTLAIANNEVSIDTTNKFYEPLLDRYEGAAAAYSLRILKGDYTGPLVRIRRDITNTEVDVYPDENLTISLNSPVLNVAESTTDVTASPQGTLATTLGEFVADAGSDPDGLGAPVSAFVVVWYDQANSNNASQDISTSQPKIYDSVDGVVTKNGKPALYFNGAEFIDVPSIGMTIATLFAVHDNGGSTSQMLGMFDRNDNSFFYDLGTYMQFRPRGGTISTTPTAQIDFKSWYLLVNAASSEAAVNNQTPDAGATNAVALARVRIGLRSPTYFTGHFYEMVLYASNESSNRAGIESNINDHYQIPSFNATASTAQTVAVYNNAINTTVDLNATYTDLKEIIKYE